jgi:GntR family transcriptional regulator
MTAVDLRELKPLDPGSRLPLYAQIADLLADKIRESQAEKAGLMLPSEKEIEAHFKVSRPTVRQAMAQLHTEGLITRGRGKGTFVSPPHVSRDLGQVVQFELMPAGRDVEFRLLKRERIKAEASIQRLFGLADGEPIERITRARFIKTKIFAYEERFVPIPVASQISDSALESEAGAVIIHQLTDAKNGGVAFRFRAIPAPARLAKILRMKVGAPVLSSEHTYYTAKDTPFLVGTIYFRGDRYDFGFRAPIYGPPKR